MARMIPPKQPPDEQGMRAERQAYREFREQLPDDFTVYWSIELLTEEAEQGEIDFLVAHPELGLLVVECKGGGVRRNEHGVWERCYRGKRERLDRSPWEQAEDQMWKLVEELERRGKQLPGALGKEVRKSHHVPLTFGHAAAFPFAERESANLSMEADDKICLANGEFAELEPAVRSAMQFWRQHRPGDGMDRDRYRTFERKMLYPKVSIAESLAARIEAEDRVFERLSDEQIEVVRAVADAGRVLVEGGAGTGKSLLALEMARMFAAGGDRVLLTCFNRKLRDDLRRRVEAIPVDGGRLDVDHFHGLCLRAARELDVDLDFPEDNDTEEARRFWTETLPMELLQGFESGELGPWDAMVVDEAQDFAESWWTILQSGLRGGTDGQLVAFHDPTQDLFDRGGDLPDFEVTLPLTHNFRNTTEICRICDRLHPRDLTSHPRTPTGEAPRVQNFETREGEFRAIERLVEGLVEERGLGPEHLVVLTPRTKQHSVLAGHDAVAGLPVTEDLEEADHKLLHSSIGAFKGLERDVVIFADVDPDHPRCSTEARYVAASRAVNRLYVFQRSDWLQDVPDDR